MSKNYDLRAVMVPAEDLRPGDLVAMRDGTAETIGTVEIDDDEMVSVDYVESGTVSVLPRGDLVKILT